MKKLKEKISNLLNSINNKLPIKFTKNRTIILLIVLCITIPIVVGKIKDKKIEDAYNDGVKDSESQEIVVTDEIVVTETELLKAMAPIAELGTYKYSYANCDMYEKIKPIIGKLAVSDKTIFAYNGTITSGIKDISEIKVEIDNDTKKVNIYLPEPVILHNEIDEDNLITYDCKDSKFVETDLSEYNEFIAKLKKNEQDKLIKDDEYWNNLRKNTENTLNSLLSQLLLDEYIIEYHWD